RLKWPNDVLIGEAKLAGILPESTTAPGRSGAVVAVVGMGLNLAGHPEGTGRPVTHLSAHGLTITPPDMLGLVAASVDDWMKRWGSGAGYELVREAWLQRAGGRGERITVNTGREIVEGRFFGIDAEGALVLRDQGGEERRFSYGDVTLGVAAGVSDRQ